MPIYPKEWGEHDKPESEPRDPVPCVPGPIRPYGPGRGDTIIDCLVYDTGLVDEEIGSNEELGWYGLVYFEDQGSARRFLGEIDLVAQELGDAPLTEDECNLIVGSRIIIIQQDSNGFITALYYDQALHGNQHWNRINRMYDEFYEERDRAESGEGGDA